MGHTRKVNIYFLSYLAKPTTLEEDGPTGAYINCWVRSDSTKSAQAQAEKDIGENGWRIECVEQPIRLVEVRPEEGVEYFEQAKVDGEVYVYHTWSGTDEEFVH